MYAIRRPLLYFHAPMKPHIRKMIRTKMSQKEPAIVLIISSTVYTTAHQNTAAENLLIFVSSSLNIKASVSIAPYIGYPGALAG